MKKLFALVMGVLIVVGAPEVASTSSTTFSLRSTNRCFYAWAVPGSSGWPLRRWHVAHAIRGSLNEPRAGAEPHWGVDVQTIRASAPVYAIAPGYVRSVASDNVSIGSSGSFYNYYHLVPVVWYGQYVWAHQYLGMTIRRYHHVHIGEYNSSCGWVDPRRPTGALGNRLDDEKPRIGVIHAYRLNSKAFLPFRTDYEHDPQRDPDRPELSLSGLHGRVDFRSNVRDMPNQRMTNMPQLPLEVAVIRGYVASATDRFHVLSRVIQVYDGAGLLPYPPRVWIRWAYGTYRNNSCYFHRNDRCGAAYVWHVSGRNGINFKSYRNGRYQFCA